jgi:hypothetical protein
MDIQLKPCGSISARLAVGFTWLTRHALVAIYWERTLATPLS